jgi:hypothetical protein
MQVFMFTDILLDRVELMRIISNTTPKKFEEIGLKMKEIADRRYTWKLIAQKYKMIIEESFTIKQKMKVIPKYSNIDEDLLLKMKMGHLKHQDTFFKKR